MSGTTTRETFRLPTPAIWMSKKAAAFITSAEAKRLLVIDPEMVDKYGTLNEQNSFLKR